jgi:ribonuclease R
VTDARERLLALLAETGTTGLTLAQIGERLGVARGGTRALRALLGDLLREGRAVKIERRFSAPPPSPEEVRAAEEPAGRRPRTSGPLLVGMLRVSQRGRSSLERGEAFDPIPIDPDERGPALDGDTVEAEPVEDRGRVRARVVHVLERGRSRLTGTLVAGAGSGEPELRVDDPRVRGGVRVTLPSALAASPPLGRSILAEIVAYPDRPDGTIEASLLRVLGDPGDLVTEVEKCVALRGLEEAFPPAVLDEAGRVPRALEPDLAAGPEREDLRAIPFVTIDPVKARDFDDAVAALPGEHGGTRVYVAVADVAHYVAEGSATDAEAKRRGLSLYLPDRAIPMLPPALSSGICSLVPGEDRHALVVRLEITARGEIVDRAFSAAIIHSQGRLDYQGVAAALRGDFEGRRAAYAEHAPHLERLARVTGVLRARRLARGSLDLDLPEAEVLLDDDDPHRIRDIVTSRPDPDTRRAYALVEELMVAANEAVGATLAEAGIETIWRVHPAPSEDALERLSSLLAHYGIDARPDRLASPQGMARLLAVLDGAAPQRAWGGVPAEPPRPDQKPHRARRPLVYHLLRALKQASYRVVDVGHFGLGCSSYLHFTSPIRRYPDLFVHRQVRALLARRGLPAGGGRPVRLAAREAIGDLAAACSRAERRAIEVEREVLSVYAASIVRDRIGDELQGTVTGVSSFGFFVGLDAPFVEGLVRGATLQGEVEFDPEALRLHQRSLGRSISLGDRVLVRVLGASLARRQIDLALDELEASSSPPASPSGRRRRPRPRDEHRRSTGKRGRGRR